MRNNILKEILGGVWFIFLNLGGKLGFLSSRYVRRSSNVPYLLYVTTNNFIYLVTEDKLLCFPFILVIVTYSNSDFCSAWLVCTCKSVTTSEKLVVTKRDVNKRGRVWWLKPVIPALWEAEAGELPEPRRQRLRWAKIAPLHSSLGNKSKTPSQKKQNKTKKQVW